MEELCPDALDELLLQPDGTPRLTPEDDTAESYQMFYDSADEDVSSDECVESNTTNTTTKVKVESTSDDSDSNGDQPDIIDNIYKSMSEIVASLNSDNLLLNIQAKKIHDEMANILTTISDLKVENKRRSSTNDTIISVVNNLKSKISNPSIVTFDNLQKQIIDTRSLLLRTITANIGSIKQELEEVRKIKGDIRPQVKSVVADEVKTYMNRMPTLDKKFNAFAREQRARLSQHIRKSTVRRVSSMKSENSMLLTAVRDQIASVDKTKELKALQKKHTDFVTQTERTIELLTIRIAELESR